LNYMFNYKFSNAFTLLIGQYIDLMQFINTILQ